MDQRYGSERFDRWLVKMRRIMKILKKIERDQELTDYQRSFLDSFKKDTNEWARG